MLEPTTVAYGPNALLLRFAEAANELLVVPLTYDYKELTAVALLEAARAFMADSLGWQVANTSDGLTAEGYSFSHRAMANLQIQIAAGGASADSFLLVLTGGAPTTSIRIGMQRFCSI